MTFTLREAVTGAPRRRPGVRAVVFALLAAWAAGCAETGSRPGPATGPAAVGADSTEAASVPDGVESQLARAGKWLAAFPEDDLRFDAAVVLFMIRKTADSPALHEAYRRARTRADRDHDHEMRRFWDSDFQTPRHRTSHWKVPRDGEPRVNVNRVVVEALYCRENGWRPETMLYLAGPMRDRGGYHTTHALWALVIARENGCVSPDEFEAVAAELRSELRSSQPTPFEPKTTGDIDLYGERLLMLLLSGSRDAQLDAWARRLLELQETDGSWGIARENEYPYRRYHATMIATWALHEWRQGPAPR